MCHELTFILFHILDMFFVTPQIIEAKLMIPAFTLSWVPPLVTPIMSLYGVRLEISENILFVLYMYFICFLAGRVKNFSQ